MKKLVGVVSSFILLFPFLIKAQIYEGVVNDKTSGDVIPYVNIALMGTYIGTVSKFDGSFRLDLTDIPEGADSLAFSIIGYEKKLIHRNELSEKSVILMSPTAVNLDAVIVSPRSPEEFLRLAIEKIPENFINEAFNGTIFFRSEMRLNGKFIESQEALIKGYIMPVAGDYEDSTRLKLLAFRYFDEQQDALNSVRIKKRKKEKWAVEGIDTALVELTEEMGKSFGVYTQIDSNLIKNMYLKGYEAGDEKYFFENMVQEDGYNFITIGFKDRENMAKHRGNILLEEESLAFARYNYQMKTQNLLIKSALLIMGYGFKRADAVIKFTAIPSELGWIPDKLQINLFIDAEKNRWFAKDIPIVFELNSQISFLDVDVPATDFCKDGVIIERGKHLKDQFKSDPDNPLWIKYADRIKEKYKN